jgi:murein DD-endopeptidase MepM/ murein hydrolase activator NlpD
MRTGLQKAKRAGMALYLIVVHLALLYFVGELLIRRYVSISPIDQASVRVPLEPKPVPTPIPVPDAFADPPVPGAETDLGPPVAAGLSDLIIPVAGVRPEQLQDTFSDARADGRYHDAIDIAAPAGTPVIAATDGEIARFWDSERGGVTIYQLTPNRKFVLYYAHLQRRAEGIAVGSIVRQGTTIGYVGDTGNAGAGNYHLHFSIAQITDPDRPMTGIYLNPYPLLKTGILPRVP